MNNGESPRTTWWRTLLIYVGGLLMILGSVVIGLLLGDAIDDYLTANIGSVQSKITGWVVMLTALLCLWDRRRQRRNNRD